MPERIQRARSKGWRMPEGAVYVGRPTPWGNPFPIASSDGELFPRAESVRMFRELVTTGVTAFGEHRFIRSDRRGSFLHVPSVDQIREHLAGHDLACWCPLDVACHADVLLEIANGDA